jgi:hypothetical protein
MTLFSPFRYFKTSPEVIRLAVMIYARYLLTLRNVEGLLNKRGIEISPKMVRFWWNKYGLMFAAGIQRTRVARLRSLQHCRSKKLPDSADRTADLQSDVVIPAEWNSGGSRPPFLNRQHVCRIAGEFRQTRNQGTHWMFIPGIWWSGSRMNLSGSEGQHLQMNE